MLVLAIGNVDHFSLAPRASCRSEKRERRVKEKMTVGCDKEKTRPSPKTQPPNIMLRTSVNALSEQLRTYCNTINSDSNLMKSKLQHPPSKSGSKADLTYLGNISAGLTDLEARADEMEVAVAGQKENRLNEITLEELLYCAASLYEANEDGIRKIKAARNPDAANTPGSVSKGKPITRSATKENKENGNPQIAENRVSAAEDQNDFEEEDLDCCVVDLSYQSEAPGRVWNNDRDETGVQSQDISAAENDFNSPESKPVNEDADPKTPSLEAWKLSHATRHILDQQRYISKGSDKSPDDSILKNRDKKSKSNAVKNYTNAQVVTHAQAETPPSPERLDMSVSYQFRRSRKGDEGVAPMSVSFGADTPIAPSSPMCNINDHDDAQLSEDIINNGSPIVYQSRGREVLSTPIDEAREILRAHGKASSLEFSSMSSSPATPTFRGTPLTCQVLAANAPDRATCSPEKSMLEEGSEDSVQSGHESTLDHSVACSEDEMLDPSNISGVFSSPPKAVKMLNPRRGENAVSADAEHGWIPMVMEEEWKGAPSFLRMQFELQHVNTTLSLLNKFIADNLTKTENGFSKRLETFSFDEIVRIVGNSIDPAPIKVVVLGLVHFKKLDVGTENSVKVYKIRRFY